MARKLAAVEVSKPIDPYLHYEVRGTWRGLILGVSPARPTMPDHLAKVIADEETRLRREERKKRPPEAGPSPESSVTPGTGEGENGEEVTQEILSQRRQWAEQALQDPLLDDDAKKMIEEALKELAVPDVIVRTVMRATNTFPRSEETGNFVVPNAWFYGGLKKALEHDGLYRDQAREIVRCVNIEPAMLDLGTDKPDTILNANVPLPGVRPGEAQATIKRFHAIDPVIHGRGEFVLTVNVLNSNFTKPLNGFMERIWRIVGSSGLGGGRPIYGTFDLLECTLGKE